MRCSEHSIGDMDFPGRYILDEARFPGGKDRICNHEEETHEKAEHHT